MKQLLQLCLAFLFPLAILAQNNNNPTTFSGLVVNEAGETLVGATVNWKDTTVGAVTDIDGWFTIQRLDTVLPHILVINYVGYTTVEVEILPSEDRLRLLVEDNATLENITVESRQRTNFTSTLDPLNIENISEGELRRAACCNLSESFENNATVNVGYTDAVTGAKEIEMLGLKGTYTQMMVENRPTFNRLGRAYGLEYISGTFIESIQISKGASSVKNGIQGITGQINTELIKPYKAPMLFLNFFANYVGRVELNAQFNYRITQDFSTGLLVHGNYYGTEVDFNGDSFLDIPKKQQINVISRWMYKPKNVHFEANFHGIWDDRSGGQTLNTFKEAFDSTATRLYQVNANVRRVGVFGKLGYFGFNNPSQSIAIIYDANIHQHQSYFGDKTYFGLQKQIYLNAIFQTDLVNPMHNLTSGITYDLVDFKEQFADINADRTEHLASVYLEYAFNKTFNEARGNSFGLILGMRGDLIHTQQFTKIYPAPRLNLKYNFTPDIVVRASVGRGVRTANLLIENLKYMPSFKDFVVQETILPEVAWNYGVNFTWTFKINSKLGGSLNLDFYRTDFENQLVTDLDSDYEKVLFYNLKGQSFANNFLVSYTQDIVKGLEIRLAYKYNDARMSFGNVLEIMPLMPQHRALIHLNYTTPKKDWEFNVTLNVMGPQRLPHLHEPYGPNLPEYRLKGEIAAYPMLNAHIVKFFKGGWEVYLGAENLTNYTQDQPILGFQDPFGTATAGQYAKFDAASVAAPVFGVQIYAGVKYTFKGKDRFPPANACSSISGEPKEEPMDEIAEESSELKDYQSKIEIKTSAQCGMCDENISKALKKVKGVESFKLNLETQVLEVVYVSATTSPEAIRKAISKAGYDADDVSADPTAYQNLAACCKKNGGHK